jgi:hypothetical protein
VSQIARHSDGRIIPVRVVDAPDDRDAAKADIEQAERTVTAIGADVEGVLRIDASVDDGMLKVVDEVEATSLVLEWQPELSPLERVFGRAMDEIGRRSPVPVIAGHVAASTFERIVLVLDPVVAGFIRRPDSEIGAQVVNQLAAGSKSIEVVVLVGASTHFDDLTLPDDVTVVRDRATEWLNGVATTDLIVIASRRFPVGSSLRPVVGRADLSVLVVSAPYRPGVSGAFGGRTASAMLGFDTTA